MGGRGKCSIVGVVGHGGDEALGGRGGIALHAAEDGLHKTHQIVRRKGRVNDQTRAVGDIVGVEEGNESLTHVEPLRLRLQLQCREVAVAVAAVGVLGHEKRLVKFVEAPVVMGVVLFVLTVDGVDLSIDG